MVNPDAIYALYNAPDLEVEFANLLLVYKNQLLIDSNTFCYRHRFATDAMIDVFEMLGPNITTSEFREGLKSIFYSQPAPKLIWDKKSPEWKSVPTDHYSYRHREHFKHYKKNRGKCTGEFEKYYKVRGIALVSPEWNEKLKNITKIPEDTFHKCIHNMVIPDRLMKVLEQQYVLAHKENPEVFWPLMTNIVPDALVREDKTYPLLTYTDIMKVEYLSSFILDKDEEEEYLVKFFNQFLKYTKNDIKNWRRAIEQKNERYRELLVIADSLKK